MIPNEYHFVWFGPTFPFTHALAIRSLAATSNPQAIHLHLSDSLEGQAHFERLVRDIPALNVRRINFNALLAGMDGVDRDGLRTGYEALLSEKRFAALSDVLRFSLLYLEGGVYLDLDTITIKDLRPLLTQPGFCGRELILVPGRAARRLRVLSRLRTGPLTLARDICARSKNGVRWFKRIAPLFSAEVNCAVLGLSKGHALAYEALLRLPGLCPEVARRRPAIGPDLLQDLVVEPALGSQVTTFGPSHFYPLGPSMAAHYFRNHPDVASLERDVVSANTHVVHWYNDHILPGMEAPSEDSVRRNAGHQLFSRIAARFASA